MERIKSHVKGRFQRIVVCLIFLFLTVCKAYSQEVQPCDSVRQVVDEMPKMVSRKMLSQLHLSSKCELLGDVKIKGIVTTEGRLTDVEVTGVSGACAANLAEQAKQLQWTPAKFHGVPVCHKMVILLETFRRE